jgi:hypothetical protein
MIKINMHQGSLMDALNVSSLPILLGKLLFRHAFVFSAIHTTSIFSKNDFFKKGKRATLSLSLNDANMA